MFKYYLTFLIENKFVNKLAMFYENWIIPPQNESLIELKRREFKEKTKYLEPKILYSLTKEEKDSLRTQGYFVDLDNKTLEQIKNFTISSNRHTGNYKIMTKNYNFALYNQRYYYTDQNHLLFYGDSQYYQKIWRNRSKVKKKIFVVLYLLFLIHWNYKHKLKQHQEHRKLAKKVRETNPEKIINLPLD